MGSCLVFGRRPATRERLAEHLGPVFDDLRCVAGPDELLAVLSRGRPDVVLLAVEPDDVEESWAAVLHRALRTEPAVPVLVVGGAALAAAAPRGGTGDPADVTGEGALAGRALELGARGFLRAEDLEDPTGLPGARRPRTTELSSRELDVLLGMTEGLSNSEIAEALVLAEDTVKTHARRLFRKLGAGDRADAVARGFRQGLIE